MGLAALAAKHRLPAVYNFPPHRPRQKKKSRSGLQSACDELIDKGAIITGE
jgi:hypothetical protein